MITAITTIAQLSALLDPKTARATHEAIRQDPGGAMMLLSQAGTTDALTVARQAAVLEEIVGEIRVPKEAAALIRNHLAPAAVAEMIAIRGDLSSTVTAVVDLDVLVDAILSSGDAAVPLLMKAWAEKLMERPDWDEILEREVGDHTLRDHLIAAVYRQHVAHERLLHEGEDEEDDGVPMVSADIWGQVGLDEQDAEERLRDMLEFDSLPVFEDEDLWEAQDRLRERRESYQEEISVADTTAAVAADIKI